MTSDDMLARVRAWRVAQGWAVFRLAVLAGVNESTLRGMDDAGWNPTVRTLRKLEALIPADWNPERNATMEQPKAMRDAIARDRAAESAMQDVVSLEEARFMALMSALSLSHGERKGARLELAADMAKFLLGAGVFRASVERRLEVLEAVVIHGMDEGDIVALAERLAKFVETGA